MELPACCIPRPEATPTERAYCAYNAAGDPATAGLNYAGKRRPTWPELPENVRTKWEAAVNVAYRERYDQQFPTFKPGDVVRLRSDSVPMTVGGASFGGRKVNLLLHDATTAQLVQIEGVPSAALVLIAAAEA